MLILQIHSEYGWEKLFSERLYLTYARNYKLNCKVARYHIIFGPQGTWDGGREKAPAALCRKIAKSDDGGEIEIWGIEKNKIFFYIDECIEASIRLLRSEWSGPVNIDLRKWRYYQSISRNNNESGTKIKYKAY